MSELQAYYDTFRTGCWATEDAEECPCHGGGWALSDVDTWHKCPTHYCGQALPEAADCLEDFEAEDYRSRLEWAVEHGYASFTHEEAARRAPAQSTMDPDGDEVPF